MTFKNPFQPVPKPVSAASSGLLTSSVTEERHVLFCGAKKSGKTSLIFTLGRGFYPPEDILPGQLLTVGPMTFTKLEITPIRH